MVEIYTLTDILVNVLAVSVGAGALIAFTPWAFGMVVVAFKNIIQKI